MRNFWLLTRFLLKTGPGNSNQKKTGKIKKSVIGNRIALYLLLGICFLPLIGLLFVMGMEGYRMLAPAGCEKMVIELVCIAGALVFFLFGITMFLSVFYMSSDIVYLLPLPFTPVQIVGAKWICCLLNEYYLVVLMFLPIFIGYGVGGRLGIRYWIGMAIGSLTLPVMPLVYAAILSMLVMRLFRNIRNKDVLSYLGFAASIVFAVGINIFVRSFDTMNAETLIAMVQNNQGLLESFHVIFPNLILLTRGISNGAIGYLFVYVGTCLIFLTLFFLIAWKVYLPGVLGMSETTGEKRRLSKGEVEKTVRRRNPVVTYAWIEWKKLYRTPVYFMNCVLMTLIWPFFLLAIVAVSLITSLGTAAVGGMLASLLEESELFGLLRGEVPVAVAILTAAGIAVMMSMMCMISSTALSRWGEDFIFIKSIPLSYREQIRGMLASGVMTSLIGTLPFSLLFNIAAVIFGLHPVTILYTIVITVVFVLFVNYEQILMDLMYPKLNWENEAQAVKQNYRAMLSAVIDFAAGGAFLALGAAGYVWLRLNIHLITILLLIAAGLCTWLLRKLVFAKGAKALGKLE
ncbi:MAG: hypothetical protein MR332_00870 [Fusicatenibacter sp.]|nr:hypothetical protein [Fusicatenibacter sp.]